MPIYDFTCPDCGNTFEKIVKSSSTLVECPKCGAGAKKQVSGSQSFYFKGSGTYSEKSMAPVLKKSKNVS